MIYVVHHANCPDGLAAAFAAYKFFGEFGATFIPRNHIDPVPEFEPGSTIYFVDIALKRDAMIAVASTAEKVVVLDHHKTAQADLVNLPENVEVVFDMTRSAAQIAWAYFFPKLPEPKVISHIADRDLWKFELRKTREITEALMSYEYDLSLYDSLITEPLLYGKLLAMGEALLRAKQNQVESLLKEVRAAEVVVNGVVYHIPVVNAPYTVASDLANALLEKYPDAPFAGCYRDGGDGRRDWSLRSSDERVDVSEVAAAFGGGGHRNASGLSEVIPDLYISTLLMTYEDVANILRQAA